MKVAVEFYGHLRSFRETADNIIENFILPLADDVDVFIHCWDETDHSDLTWHNKNCKKRGHKVTKEDLDFLRIKFKPKALLCEPQLIIDNDYSFFAKKSGRNVSLKLIKNTYYTRYKVSQLRQEYERAENIKYDYVIQARLDLKFFKKADFLKNYHKYMQDMIPDLQDMIFYSWCGSEFSYIHHPVMGRGGTDVLYFGVPEAMNKLSNLYENIDNINLEKYCVSLDYFLLYNAVRQHMQMIPFEYCIHKDFTIVRTKETLKQIKQNKQENIKNNIKKFLSFLKFLYIINK